LWGCNVLVTEDAVNPKFYCNAAYLVLTAGEKFN
jgi:hypothetical protein